jgi:hypothetical protein
MHSEQAAHASARLVTALRIYAAGLAMKRAQLRRDHPEASASQVQRMLAAWVQRRGKRRQGLSRR